jgi:hypothetical protein
MVEGLMVSQTVASWNQISAWLRRLGALHESPSTL